MANEAQQALLESYPDIDLLPFKGEDEAAEAVRERRTGDTLFEFLWLELGDCGGTLHDAADALVKAQEDIERVKHGIEQARAGTVIGYQIIDPGGEIVHGDDDDPFDLTTFSVLRGKEAVSTARTWIRDKASGFSLREVLAGDIDEPEFVDVLADPATLKTKHRPRR